MARLNRGPNGPFSGKVGSVIGSSWKGIYYIKGLQKRKKKKKRSIGQIEQQGRFSFAVRFLSPMKYYLDKGFSRVNPKASTGYNMALSHMLLNSIKGNYPDFVVDYSNVQLSHGRLPLPDSVSAKMEGNILQLSWSTESDKRHASMQDNLELYVLYTKTNEFQIIRPRPLRIDGYCKLKLLDEHKEETKHLFVCMVNEMYNHYSKTLYVGPLQTEI